MLEDWYHSNELKSATNTVNIEVSELSMSEKYIYMRIYVVERALLLCPEVYALEKNFWLIQRSLR